MASSPLPWKAAATSNPQFQEPSADLQHLSRLPLHCCHNSSTTFTKKHRLKSLTQATFELASTILQRFDLQGPDFQIMVILITKIIKRLIMFIIFTTVIIIAAAGYSVYRAFCLHQTNSSEPGTSSCFTQIPPSHYFQKQVGWLGQWPPEWDLLVHSRMRIAMRPKAKAMRRTLSSFLFPSGKFVINTWKEKLAKAGVSTLKLTSLTFPSRRADHTYYIQPLATSQHPTSLIYLQS